MNEKANFKNGYKKAMKKHKGNKRAQIWITVIFALVAGLTLVLGELDSSKAVTAYDGEGKMMVHYIDVGQGDATLLQINDKNLLIDAGPNKSSAKLVDYIKTLGVTTIDYVVATHPHEDHIGGMDEIFDEFKVENFMAPKVNHTTKTFEKLMTAVANEGLKVKTLKEGTGNLFDLGKDVEIDVYSPVREKYEELNDYSPIMKITFGNTSFMFTGDAEKLVEKEVLQDADNLKSNVLKSGHHGSTTSSSKEFVQAVNPDIVVIPVGSGNDYGHPHKETLELYNNMNIDILRNDELGNVVLESNGNEITVK